jgi:three-Cys-motif partner protein
MGSITGIRMNEEKTLFPLPAQNVVEPKKKFKQRNPIWTECKAKLIERYLYYFVQITKNGTYIDAFSGPQEADKHNMWAAKLVVESRPRWFRKFYLFELNESSVDFLIQMRENQLPRDKIKKEPKRTIEIIPGDFNKNISEILTKNPVGHKEAAFCLLDQRTRECDWESVKIIANHKKGGNKIELFYFFPEGWINRSIAELEVDKDEKLQKWWGNSDWKELLKWTGASRAKFVCDRFKTEFNYKHVRPFPIYEKREKSGRIMYYMIHASDHDEAPVLMHRAYGKALETKESRNQMNFIGCDFAAAALQVPLLT